MPSLGTGMNMQAQRQVQQDESSAEQTAADMSSLIPEYRCTLARMKQQVDELHLKLDEACQERASLMHQVGCCLGVGCLHSANKTGLKLFGSHLDVGCELNFLLDSTT